MSKNPISFPGKEQADAALEKLRGAVEAQGVNRRARERQTMRTDLSLTNATTPEVRENILARMSEINADDTGSVIRFGSRAQAGLQEISRSMLADVRNKDVGPAERACVRW